jgi:diguanylate cyclase (GGDEF)-like protein
VRGRRATHVGGIHRRLHRYVGAVAAIGAVCLLWAVVSLVQSPPDNWTVVGLAVATMIAGRIMALRVRVGSTTIQFDWAEAALIIAVVLVDGPVVVVGAAVAVTAVMMWNRFDPLKQLFNVSTTVITASTVTWIAHSLAPGGAIDPMSPAGAVAILAGISTYPVLNDFAVAAAMAHDRGLAALRNFVGELSTLLVTFVGNVTAAFGVLALAAANPLFLILCTPILWLVHQAYVGRIQARLERVAWQRLAAAIHGLSRLDEAEVAGAAVRGAADLFGADIVEIEVVDGSGARRLTRGDAHGDLWSGAPGEEARTESTVLPVPLADRRGDPIGELRLCFGSHTTLGTREELALASFADALVSALSNAQVHDRLRAVASRNAHDVTHDALTGLPNRHCLLERGETLRSRVRPGSEDGALALLLLDFDQFKEVDATLGHAAGDLLLSSVAARLTAAKSHDEMLVRLDGDEFAVLLQALPDAAAASRAADRARELLAVVGEPILVDGVTLTVEAGVGLAVTPLQADDCDTAELLRRAEVAKYQGKRIGGGIVAYDARQDAGAVDRLAMVGELRTALAQSDQLVLHLQPSIDLASGAPIGAEALIRWDHPRRGPMLPTDFVPLVEHTDLVRPFSRYVVDRALEVSSAWMAEGLRLPIAVNLSARSLLDRDLPADIGAMLATYRVPPELLVLEITETVVMSDLEVVEEVLAGLRALGVQLSVDDFGTGYSSLTFLARVPVDEVKIDRSFVGSMMSSAEGAAIVRMTIELGHALALRVVAEGVERPDQLAALTRLGCDAAQGNHLYPPMTVDDATDAVWAALAGAERDHGPSVVRLRRSRRTDER